MDKFAVLGVTLLLAATLNGCGSMQSASTSSPNYNPYTSGLGPCPQWLPGDDAGGCSSQVAPTAQVAAAPKGR